MALQHPLRTPQSADSAACSPKSRTEVDTVQSSSSRAEKSDPPIPTIRLTVAGQENSCSSGRE
ncbi:MAG: hypothetical protein FRX49_10893 [Trebouxia sp. A1-2]|nr:MAG: hypothetical protein FRX49_10893 [Trebouxia sp. A1-2]